MFLAPFGDRCQPPTEPFSNRPHVYCELSLPAASADMR